MVFVNESVLTFLRIFFHVKVVTLVHFVFVFILFFKADKKKLGSALIQWEEDLEFCIW